MRLLIPALILSIQLVLSTSAYSQVMFSGKVWAPRTPEAMENMPTNDGLVPDYFAPPNNGCPPDIMAMPNVRCFASPDGATGETIAFRTWELAPRGWYRLTGPAGKYTMMFTGPAHGMGAAVFIRPTIFTNMFTKPGDVVNVSPVPTFDYAVLYEGGWDNKAAAAYYQTFTAKGTGITGVAFKAVHDGVDGQDAGGQTILVSIVEKGPGAPDTWKQVGPSMPVLNLDCGGAKNYEWTVGWDSGQVPTVPGKTYAVCLKPEDPQGKFQMFQKPDEGSRDCYRVATDGTGAWVNADLWMAVTSDSDGLLVPYNKHIQLEYAPDTFAGTSTKWSQTYVAQGRSLAGVVLYAATSGIQPSMNRQRLRVRVREGGPKGHVVGDEKIAIGNGYFTGDASWGTFGAAFAPGEVPLVPGKTYAIEFETMENYASLHGYANIKGMVSDDKPGFNPYTKVAPDTYEKGTAYKNGTEDANLDLDMQIVEYKNAVKDWEQAVDGRNLIRNGGMQVGRLVADKPEEGSPSLWQEFSIDPDTTRQYLLEREDSRNRILRVIGGSVNGKTVDGGYVQRVDGLDHLNTYRLSGEVRSSWTVDLDHACYVGYDPTGQTDDPEADTIVWTSMPKVHSVWTPYASEPIRPVKDSISVWLRGYTKSTGDFPFKADFDNFELHRVKIEVPGANQESAD